MTVADTAEAVLNAAEGLLRGRFEELTSMSRPDGDDIKRGSNANDHGYVGAYFGNGSYFAVIAEVWPSRSPRASPVGTFSATVMISRPAIDAEYRDPEEYSLTGRGSLEELRRELLELLDGFNPYSRPFVVMLTGDCQAFSVIELGSWQESLASGQLPGNRIAVVLAESDRQALIDFRDSSRRSKPFDVMIAAGLDALPDVDHAPTPGHR